MSRDLWLNWAREIVALSQIGRSHTEGEHDRDRYDRVAEVAWEIVAGQRAVPVGSGLGDSEGRREWRGGDRRNHSAYLGAFGRALVLREHNRVGGGWQDTIAMGILRSGFDANPTTGNYEQT